ncbi:MAG TPA: hypothetical protein VGF28_08275 [Thermoanaerobaculia bacterium]|jgi:hypothetical protein
MKDDELLDDEEDATVVDEEQEDLLWEDGDPADRRKDPLRRPDA